MTPKDKNSTVLATDTADDYQIDLSGLKNSFATGNYGINTLTAGFNGVITGAGALGALQNTYSGNLTISNPYTPNSSLLEVSNSSGLLSIKGDNADIDLNGKSLKTWMEAVEKRLAILQPNTTLESEWEELKELGDRYRQLEQKINEKMKTWNILKKE